MRRIFTWLALLVAVGVAVVSVIELDSRSDDDQSALAPTALPSPTDLASAIPDETDEPTDEPTDEATDEPLDTATAGAAQATPEETVEATPSVVDTPAPTEEPSPTATVAPPSTPTPPPALTPGARVAGTGTTPKTGGGAVIPGVVIALLATGGRVLLARRPGR